MHRNVFEACFAQTFAVEVGVLQVTELDPGFRVCNRAKVTVSQAADLGSGSFAREQNVDRLVPDFD